MKHTPGPWKIVDSLRYQHEKEIWAPSTDDNNAGTFIATIHYYGCDYKSDSEPDANARLIAAVPVMYEALKYIAGFKKLLNSNLDWTEADIEVIVERAETAITKAEYEEA